MNCPTCGRSAPAGDRFCASCGAELHPDAAVATAAGPSPRQPAGAWHPAVAGWAPAPPPARRRVGPALLAALIGALLLFGGIGLFAARTVATRAGAGSPEAAATGLLAALDRQDLKRAAGHLDGSERQLVDLYGNRLASAVVRQRGGTTASGPLAGLDLTARDVRFQRVAGTGDVAVLDLVAGTIGVTEPGGVKVELPVQEARRRLAESTGGHAAFPRLVVLRSDGRWYVSLLASAAEWSRLAGRAGPADYARLAGTAAGQGADSPEAAVRGLVGALATGPPATLSQRLLPEERRVAEAYQQPLVAKATAAAGRDGAALLTGRGNVRVRVEGLTVRTEPLADGVVKVDLTGGTVVVSGVPGYKPTRLDRLGHGEPLPAVVAVRRDGAWYPSLTFSAADALLANVGREHK